MDFLDKMLRESQERRERDAKRFEESDGDLCMLCGAYGADKRSLTINCGYAVHEAIPEAIDTFLIENMKDRGYYLRLCKTCRGELIAHMRDWRNERIAMRGVAKNHDGYPEDSLGTIPVRINGMTVMMSEEGYEEYRRRNATE